MAHRVRAQSVCLRAILALFLGLAAFGPGLAHDGTAAGRRLHFEPGEAGFSSGGRGYALHLTSNEATMFVDDAVVRMRLLGAAAGAPGEGLDLLSGRSHYLIGRDAAKWRRNVPHYARVRYRNVYRGIDLVYYGSEGQLEYDFIVQPGADPTKVRLRIEGVDETRIDPSGDLVLVESGGNLLRMRKPTIYQEIDGVRREIAGGYRLQRGSRNTVGFRVAEYDEAHPLVIDPVVIYSSYLGGSGTDDGSAVATDATGNTYVTGQAAVGFPTTPGAWDEECTHIPTLCGDAFVSKFSPEGSTLIYSTFVGGSYSDAGYGIAVDAAGHAYITGEANSPDFPLTPGAIQTACDPGAICGQAFVAKLSPDGSDVIFSTFLGGTLQDRGFGIAVDAGGVTYVAGNTLSTDFPTTAGAYQTEAGGGGSTGDAWVAKINADGTALIYATYLGGSGSDDARELAIDAAGSAYVTGGTFSTDFPTTAGAFDTTYGGGGFFGDAFVSKLSTDGSVLIYSTYLGGSDGDDGRAIAVDAAGQAHVTGVASSDFPTTPGAFDTTFGGAGGFFGDAFVLKLAADGSAPIYSTFLGGVAGDDGRGVVLDSAGNAWVTGLTNSDGFPTTPDAFQGIFGGSGGWGDAFVTELSADGSAVLYSTYLGGSDDDFGQDIALDAGCAVSVAGFTESADFPATPGAFQTTFAGGDTLARDAWAARIALPPSVDGDGDGFAVCAGDCDDGDANVHPGAIEVCNGVDDNCDAAIDDVAVPSTRPTVYAGKSGSMTALSWAAAPDATGYDAVKGNIGPLRNSNGNFRTTTKACIANDIVASSLQDAEVPPPGGGLWFLVRPVNACSGPGTYDSEGTSQQGSRDAEIMLSANACP